MKVFTLLLLVHSEIIPRFCPAIPSGVLFPGHSPFYCAEKDLATLFIASGNTARSGFPLYGAAESAAGMVPSLFPAIPPI